MSDFIDPAIFTPPPPPPVLPAAAQAALTLTSQSVKLFMHSVTERIRLYNLLWYNPACDPPTLARQLGTKLMSLFARDAKHVEYLVAQAQMFDPPVALPPEATVGVPPEWIVTPNTPADGGAMITAADPGLNPKA